MRVGLGRSALDVATLLLHEANLIYFRLLIRFGREWTYLAGRDLVSPVALDFQTQFEGKGPKVR